MIVPRSTKGTNANTFVLFVPFCGCPKTLEDELEGELHLPAPLLTYIARKITRVVKVSIWGRAVHAVQHVVRREPELNIERLANRRNREVFEKRSVPVKLWPATKDIASERSNVRTACITGEDPRLRAPESRAIQLKALSVLGVTRIRISNQIHAPAIARHVEYWTTLPDYNVVELPIANRCVKTLMHVTTIASASSERQIPNIRKGKAVPYVCFCISAIEIGPRWIIRTTITRTRPIVTNTARRVIDGVGPRIRRQDR